MKYWADNGGKDGRAVEIKFSATVHGHRPPESAGHTCRFFAGRHRASLLNNLRSGHRYARRRSAGCSYYRRRMEEYKFVGEGM